MKNARSLSFTLRRLSAGATLGAALLLGAAIVGCDDENDPKTWVKRLDDPAQRANAIKRLTQFYEDDMTRASNNQSAPEVKDLLDTIVDPLTRQYTAGSLDDKTRTDLIKFLAETHDPRTQPALAKALKDFEMGRTDDEVRVSTESINVMAKAGVKLDKTVIDELWNVFAKFKLSKTNSQRLYQGIHDAVVAVHDPSYGDKAIEKLKVPVAAQPSVDEQKDQLMWWQLTSVQVISELRYAPAVKPLVVTLLTQSKTAALGATIQFALLKMAKDAEPELIKALSGSDPDYAKAETGYEDKAYVGVVARVLAQIGRAPGRDAILQMLPTADTDTARTELAQALPSMPSDPRVVPAYLAAYDKLKWDASDVLLGGLKPRSALAQQAANFYDPKLVDWLLKGVKKAPEFTDRLVILDSAQKLMTSEKKADVADLLTRVKKEAPADVFSQVQSLFDGASAALDKCKADLGCYLGILDQPIPSSPPTANGKAVKAASMAVVYGSGSAASTRSELVKRLEKTANPGVRIALCEAISALSPQGDVATADALDRIVAADAKSGDKGLVAIDNTVVQLAWRLRGRAH
jgi:hypothetical protein